VTISQAYDLIDQLLDKSDQPYFTENEKDDFIRQAIHEFINNHYAKYDINQVSRDALAMFTESIQLDSNDNNWDNFGLDMPDEYVHLIHFRINYTNALSTAENFNAAKIIGSKDFWDLENSKDPYNRPDKSSPICYVRQPGPTSPVRVYFRPTSTIGSVSAMVLRSRRHDECFDDTNPGDGLKEVYQREVIEIAVRKMTGNIESNNYKVALNEQQQSKTK
tara:strand:+ start:3353 stop:4012 length:660 start_codon:yes stop_codon:yes gene_type:complete